MAIISRPKEAGEVNVKVDSEAPGGADGIVTIDLDEFQAARRDPRVRNFLNKAKRYGAQVEREGRSR